MSLEIRKVRANTDDPFSRRARSPIYADHMARWEPEPIGRVLLRTIGGVLRRRNAGELSELETRDALPRSS